MVIVDTSVWVDLFRDGSGIRRQRFEATVDVEEVVIPAFTELELLQGARDENEWLLLADYLATQEVVDPERHTWARAARTYFDLRRTGRTVRSPIDCCIAQLAIDHRALLVHVDRDFETIAAIRPLQQLRIEWA